VARDSFRPSSSCRLCFSASNLDNACRILSSLSSYWPFSSAPLLMPSSKAITFSLICWASSVFCWRASVWACKMACFWPNLASKAPFSSWKARTFCNAVFSFASTLFCSSCASWSCFFALTTWVLKSSLSRSICATCCIKERTPFLTISGSTSTIVSPRESPWSWALAGLHFLEGLVSL